MKNKTEGQYVLVTGASCGLGKELAKECARRGMNLLLTALPNENIRRVGAEFSGKYGVNVCTFEADLTNPEELKKLASSVSEKYEVKMLINNAGLGGTKKFLEATPEYIEQIVMLNVYALVLLTRILLPNLKRQKNAFILNIASMASFSPMPFKTVYPASKAFVYSFSRGLDAELKDTGVSVSVAHPGGMKTNAEVTNSIENYNRIIRATTLSVEKVAQICISSLMKHKRIIIPGFLNKLSWVLLKIIPLSMRFAMMRSSIRRDIELKNERLKQPCNSTQ